MPPPLPPGELGHSLGPREARVTLGGHLDYVVRQISKPYMRHYILSHRVSRRPTDWQALFICFDRCYAVSLLEEDICYYQKAGGTALSQPEL